MSQTSNVFFEKTSNVVTSNVVAPKLRAVFWHHNIEPGYERFEEYYKKVT
jgi:hypothetical protein